MSVQHYENFPVASWLCPPELRGPIAAIYWFARTADDIADEGPGSPQEREATLLSYRSELARIAHGERSSGPWREIFDPLDQAMRRHALPHRLLDDLLRAFLQDVRNPPYGTREELLDYCRLSANPVGRLLLHLHGIVHEHQLWQSDCICSALQLINFWQDLGIDLSRGRCYIAQADAQRHGIDLGRWEEAAPESTQALVRELCAWAGELMQAGAGLVHALPGRSGWELRMVVQGGLRILDKIAAGGFNTWRLRPRLRAWDALPMFWKSAAMSFQPMATSARP